MQYYIKWHAHFGMQLCMFDLDFIRIRPWNFYPMRFTVNLIQFYDVIKEHVRHEDIWLEEAYR